MPYTVSGNPGDGFKILTADTAATAKAIRDQLRDIGAAVVHVREPNGVLVNPDEIERRISEGAASVTQRN